MNSYERDQLARADVGLRSGQIMREAMEKRAPRMYVQTLEPLAGAVRTVEAQFNPVSFTEKGSAKYVGWEVPGLSHEVLQFIGTKNYDLPFELRFIVDSSIGKATEQVKRFAEYRRILWALLYPRPVGKGISINGAAPHRVLVCWPNLIALTCVLKDLEWTFNRFNNEGTPVDQTAKVLFTEIRDVRISADDVYLHGTNRGGERMSNVSPGGFSDYSERF